MQTPGQRQLPVQPSQRPSSPVQFLLSPTFAPGRVGRGRGQLELANQPKLQCQSSLLNPQPAQSMARCLSFSPGMTPLDHQLSRLTVDHLFAHFRRFGPPLPRRHLHPHPPRRQRRQRRPSFPTLVKRDPRPPPPVRGETSVQLVTRSLPDAGTAHVPVSRASTHYPVGIPNLPILIFGEPTATLPGLIPTSDVTDRGGKPEPPTSADRRVGDTGRVERFSTENLTVIYLGWANPTGSRARLWGTI